MSGHKIVESLKEAAAGKFARISIPMRMPNGKQSMIQVTPGPDGKIDLTFSRSSEGELLIMLPAYAAKQLGEALLLAVTASNGGAGSETLSSAHRE